MAGLGRPPTIATKSNLCVIASSDTLNHRLIRTWRVTAFIKVDRLRTSRWTNSSRVVECSPRGASSATPGDNHTSDRAADSRNSLHRSTGEATRERRHTGKPGRSDGYRTNVRSHQITRRSTSRTRTGAGSRCCIAASFVTILWTLRNFSQFATGMSRDGRNMSLLWKARTLLKDVPISKECWSWTIEAPTQASVP